MRAYHLDLRERIVAAVASGSTVTMVASQFRVDPSTVYRYLARQQTRGTLVPGTSSGRPRAIAPAAEPRLVAQLVRLPQATLAEQCAQWQATTGVEVSTATMSRMLRRIGWTRKKGVWQPASGMPTRGLPGGTRR
jgi:transposase